MKNEIEKIIHNLLSTDTEVIRKATNDLNEAYKNEQTIPALCDIIVTSPEPQIRQYSAVLLSKRLGKLRNWQQLSREQQQFIKQGILNALVQEQEKSVRNGIAMFVGALVRHESENEDGWMTDLLQFIYTRCSSADLKEAELGSSIFATLTDTAPDQFVPHMEAICGMFTQALLAAEANGNMASPVIANIMAGMTYLSPFIVGHQRAEQTMVKAMPLLLKAMHAFAYSNEPDQFSRAFDLLDGFAEFSPKLLNNNFKEILDFCLEISNNKQLDSNIRAQGITFVGRLVRLKRKSLVKQKLVEPILQVVFNMMCDETEEDTDDDEDFFGSGDGANSVSSASQTLDLLALNLSPDKLIPPLLLLLEPALQDVDPNKRRGAFLCMAVIAEGCSEAICSKYLSTMLNIIKVGISDQVPHVRNGAFFALGQFSEHLQPDISNYASVIMPVLFEFLHRLCEEIKSGAPEPKHIGRMFYALETFCENLEENIVPHLPILMERLFEALNPSNSPQMRQLALCSVTASATAAKEHLTPYFQQLIAILQPYLIKTEDEDAMSLRSHALDTLAAIARSIGKTTFLPIAQDLMSFCLLLLDDPNQDPDCRRAVYNLVGGLASVVNDEMASVFPKIMPRILDSVISTEEVVPEFKENTQPTLIMDGDEIDIENTDDEDDDDNILGYNVENDYVNEKEEAIICLKEMCLNSSGAFQPYLQSAFENVYKMIDHPQEVIRTSSIDTLGSFVVVLNQQQNSESVRKATQILVPKLLHIIREDDDILVPIRALETLGEVMKEVRQNTLPSEEFYDQVFMVINDVLTNKVACQFDEAAGSIDDEDEEESEYGEVLIEAAGNLLARLGLTMSSEIFSVYFGRIYPFFLQKLKKAKKDEYQAEQRAFVYGALSECLEPLGKFSGNYFEVLCPLFIGGLSDPEAKARQNSCFGLGELVLHSQEKSFEAYPIILQALSELLAKETDPSALDNICSAVARLILTNYTLVPLQQVLPVFFSSLPLREDVDENDIIFKCFKLLFVQARQVLVDYIEQMLAIAIHVIYKKQFPDQQTCDNAMEIIKVVRENYLDKFQAVANSNPDVYNFVQTL